METGRGGNLEKLGRKWKRGLAGEKGDRTRNEMEEKGVENGREGGGGGGKGGRSGSWEGEKEKENKRQLVSSMLQREGNQLLAGCKGLGTKREGAEAQREKAFETH